MRKAAVILILSVLAGCLSGCFDASEIDDILQVSAIGIDKGVTDRWRVTIQFPALKEGGGGGSSGESSGEKGSGGGGESGEESFTQDGFTIVSADAPSFYEALAILDTSVPRNINFMQTQIIVFSEDVAKRGDMGEFIEPLMRFREIRRTSFIFVSKGKAIDFIKANKPYIGTDISKNYRIWSEETRDTGYIPYVTIGSFYESLKSPKSQAIATLAAVNDFSGFEEEGEQRIPESTFGSRYLAGELPRIGDNKLELWGTAIFDGEVMRGELSGDETRCLLMLRNEFTKGIYTFPDPAEEGRVVVIEVRKARPVEIKIDFIDTVPHIQAKVRLQGNILSIQGKTPYEQSDKKAILEEAVRQKLRNDLRELADKCVGLNADVLRFGETAARKFLTIGEFAAYNWNDRFKDAVIDIDVEFAIRRTGNLIRSGPIDE